MPNFHLWLRDEEQFAEILTRSVQEGALLERSAAARVAPFANVVAMIWPETEAIKYRVHEFVNHERKSLEVRTANPIAPFGAAHPFWIERIVPNNLTGEAMVHGFFGGPEGLPLAYFDPCYCDTHHLYRLGELMAVRFAGLALRAEILRETTIEITEGPMIEMERERVREEDRGADLARITSVTGDLSEMRSYLPSSEKEWADSGAFQTVMENLERLPGPAGVEILKWDGTYITEGDAWPTLRLPAYIAASRLQEKLQDAAPARGTLWLQGQPG